MSVGVLVAVGSVDFETPLLVAAGGPGLHVARRCVDVADLLATAASRQAEVALVSFALRELDVETVTRLRGEGVAVIGVVTEQSSADEAGLRQLGIDRVLAMDRLGNLREHIEESVRQRSAAAPTATEPGPAETVDAESQPPRGTVLAVWGPTGAPGRSLVALGLGSALARAGAETVVIDADVYGGSIAQSLGLLDEASGLLAATRSANTGRLRPDVLALQAREVAPSLRVVTGLPRADRWTEVRPALLRRVLEVASSLCRFTVVDCGFNLEYDEEISYDTAAPRRNGATMAALERADRVVVVGRADPVGLARLVRAVDELAGEVPTADVHVVVNRMRASLGWSADEVATMVRRTTPAEKVGFLPDDPAACDRAAVRGATLPECAPASKLTSALAALAHELTGLDIPRQQARRWGVTRAS